MNTIYKSILLLGAGIISLSSLAQKQDSLLTRQVNLEREYNPTLNEATKINTAPNIFSPQIQSPKDVRFATEAPQLNIKGNKLGKVASGDIRTNVPFSKQRFYLKGGAGSHGNIEGVLGLRAIDALNDKLDITAGYSGASGNVDYADPQGEFKKAKAKFNDMKVGLNYQHFFTPSIFTIGGWYQGMGYNYYGNPFSSDITLDDVDLDTKQKIDLFSFNAGLKSSDENEGLLKYAANIAYTSFKTKYGTYLPPFGSDKGPKGGIIDADFNFYSALGEGNIGVGANFLNQSFSGDYPEDSDFEGLTNITLNPYYKIGNLNWDVNIGANLSYVNDNKSKFVITPNVTAQVHINELNTLYAGVTGGVNNNTFVDILNENRYVRLSNKVKYSKTVFDINAGFKSGVIPNLEFEIFGGYKLTKNDHLYTGFSAVILEDNYTSWANMNHPVYDDVSTGHFGGQVKTKLIPLTTLKARLTGYFYNVDKEKEAWGKPKFTAELTADIKPFDKLTISLQYLLMTGRKNYALTATYEPYEFTNGQSTSATGSQILAIQEVDMKAVNEFNTHVEYELLNWLSVYGRVNNILNQKYEKQLGYTMQGINFLGGVSLKF